MTTNINADDGVVSGVAGLKTSADNSGVLALQTNGTTALTVNASQNVGIATTSPLVKLHVATGGFQYGSASDYLRLVQTNTNEFGFLCAPLGNYSFNFNTSTGGIKALNTIGVGDATPSTSGAGITFPATQSASSNANTLDDYEEGTWTPSIGGTATYSARWGTYTKIGNLVTIMFNISISSIGTGSTGVISGLPFTINNPTYANDQSGVLSYFNGIATSVVFIALRGSVGGTTLFFSGLTAASTGINNSLTVFQNGATIQAGITYQTST